MQDGVPESLTALLSSRPELRIMSNRQAQEFADSTDLVAVGHSLKVDRLITGNLLKADEEVRVTVQLVDAADGSVQWSKTSQHAVDSCSSCKTPFAMRSRESFRSTHSGRQIGRLRKSSR